MNMSITANSFESFSDSEWLKINKELQKYHSLFYKFWQLGKPFFTNSIPTAAIFFNKDGEAIKFGFNKNFWDSITDYKKLFVICHECLHAVLNHGVRFKDVENQYIANIAEDLAINHMLIDNFGFVREEIEEWDKYCWVETVFKDKKYRGMPYPTDESSEFYYNQICKISKEDNESKNDKKNSNNDSANGSQGDPTKGDKDDLPNLVDSHDEWQATTQEEISDIINKVVDNMPDEEKQSIINKLKSDNIDKTAGVGSILAAIDLSHVKKVKKKTKWETIIKKWSKFIVREKEHMEEQWLRKNRRFSNINLNNDLMLPSDHDVHDICYDKDRIKLFFFLDTSGSCINYAERFFKAAMSLDPLKFDIRLFCFDTEVTETTLASKTVYGGGGTSFACIENKIQEIMKSDNCAYPDAIFVISDGYGNNFDPEFPKKWFWFLTEPSTRNFIPKLSKIFMLTAYE